MGRYFEPRLPNCVMTPVEFWLGSGGGSHRWENVINPIKDAIPVNTVITSHDCRMKSQTVCLSGSRMASHRPPPRFYRIPDHCSGVGPVEAVYGDEAGGGCDVDLGQVMPADDVDADEQQPARL